MSSFWGPPPNTPIFNLANLDAEGLLDLNPFSASQDDLSITLSSSKAAASSSYAVSADLKASVNVMGIVGGSAAAHYEHSMALANSDGNVYVTMTRGRHGSYFRINTGDFADGYDFTPFLIGSELDETTVKAYVDYTQQAAKGTDERQYIDTLIFEKNRGKGQIDWSQRNVYGNIQLLTVMESIFALIRKQYDDFAGDQEIQQKLYCNMGALKSKIGCAVQDFYAHVGTHFVSKLKFANYAYGYGILHFDEKSGNTESQLGAAVSLSGSIPSKVGAEIGASASYAKQEGWAQYMKNLHIEAHMRPAVQGTDIITFADKIMTVLNDENKPLAVPNLNVPTTAKVELLEQPEVKKKSLGPPDSVFASYKEWKDYQEDLKKDKLEKSIKNAAKKVEENPLELELKNNAGISGVPLADTDRKTHSTKEVQSEPLGTVPAGNSANILRIDDMFVSGFETTPYEHVIPSLRTCKIVLPDREDQISTYPNVSRLLALTNIFRQLADYTNYVCNFTISNISKKFNSGISDFYDFFSAAGYDLMTKGISEGKDIDPEKFDKFAAGMYGHSDGSDMKQTQLYQALDNDVDRANYVKFLLHKDVIHLWRKAPGGYVPFIFDHGQLSFAALDRFDITYLNDKNYSDGGYKYRLIFKTTKKVDDVPEDISLFYQGLSQSPLYPIFRYEQKNNPRLLFLQVFGKNQIIYGKNGIIHPRWREVVQDTENFTFPILKDCFARPSADISEMLLADLLKQIQGFDVTEDIDNDHALYFPNRTQSRELRENYKVLVFKMAHGQRPLLYKPSSVVVPTKTHSLFHGGMADVSLSYAFTDLWNAIDRHMILGRAGQVVRVDDGAQTRIVGFRVLLPVDYSKIQGGYGSLLMGSSFGTNDLINSPTFDTAVINSIHGQKY